MDPIEKINPYAPSMVEEFDPPVIVVVDDRGRWFHRVLWGNYILLAGSLVAGIFAMAMIFSIVFASMMLTPLCIFLVTLVFLKKLPHALAVFPVILLVFMLMVFLTINLLNLSPTRAAVPVGRACLAVGLHLQLGWILLAHIRNEERQSRL